MNYEEHGHPEFAIVMRGYDRLQVDEYVATQVQSLREAQARVAAAEQTLAECRREMDLLRSRVGELESAEQQVRPALAALGKRVGRILNEAWEAAEAVRAEAAEEARQALLEARERVAAIETAAEEDRAEAARLRGEAASVADAAVRRANDQAGEIVARLIQEAEAKAEQAQANADAECRARLEQAGKEAATVVGEAWAERDRVLLDLADQRDELLQEITAVQAHRDAVLEAIERLQGALRQTLAGLPAGVAGTAGEEPPSASDPLIDLSEHEDEHSTATSEP